MAKNSNSPVASLRRHVAAERAEGKILLPDRRVDRLSHRHVHPRAGHRSGCARALLPGPGRHDPEHVQHVLGRRPRAPVHPRAGRDAVHLGVDHRADDGGRRAAAAGAAQGRRGGPPQAHAIHALGHRRSRGVPGRRRGHRVPEPGRRDRTRTAVRVPRDDDTRGRHHVPDVARRADHRARSWQRHFDDHPRGYRRGAAGRHRRHAGTRSQRRDQPGAGVDPGRHDRGRDSIRRVRRTRAASHPGQLREAPAGSPRLRGHHDAPAFQAQHVGCDPADLRLQPAAVPGDDRELVRYRTRTSAGCRTSRRAWASASPCTWSSTPA